MTFKDFASTYGIILPDDMEVGRWISARTTDKPREKKARFILDPNGETGTVMDWRTGEKHFWRANGDDPDTFVPTIDSRARREEERRSQEAATRGAQRYYDRAMPLKGPTKYLIDKELGVDGCEGIRCMGDGELVVPMFVRGKLSSVQRIMPDGSKLFWTHAPVKGALFSIRRRDSVVTLFCEGVATGLLLFTAVPTATVICTFSASNLPVVASYVSPHGMVCVCCDNDSDTEVKIGRNPGIDAGKKAAEAIGAGLAIPDARGSDWLDVYQERMQTLRDDNTISKWKRRPDDIRKAALAEIRIAVMNSAKFIPHSQSTE